MTTSSFSGSENNNGNSSRSSSPNSRENIGTEQMISLETKESAVAAAIPPLVSQSIQNNCIPTGLVSDKGDLAAVRLIDMSSSVSTMRSIIPPASLSPPTVAVNLQHIEATDSAKGHGEPLWTNSQLNSAGAIHRKSFNIDALLAKTKTTVEQEKERFLHSPDSANDCYNEDRRDFTPSPR